MNHWSGTGRTTREPDIRATSKTTVARFTVACNRPFKKDETDFISCVAFGKAAEFIEKYVRKGTKIEIDGRIQTGSYEKDGKKIYTTEVVAESVEFAESKKSTSEKAEEVDDFVNVPVGVAEELPFA